MPFDFRRIQGPEISEDYRQYISASEKKEFKLLSHNKLRNDGRKCAEMRKIFLKSGIVSQAKGSAYIEVGNTKIICSVFDPREKPRSAEHNLRGDLYCEFKFASFSTVNRKTHSQDSEDKEYSLLLKNALEPAVCLHEFPNFQVDVYVLVLEDDGSALAAAITCAGLALADAAVPMYDLVVGTSKAILGSNDFMDPNAKEETIARDIPFGVNTDHGVVTIAVLPAFSQVAQLVHVGSLTPTRLEESLADLTKAGGELYQAVQSCLLTSVKDQLKHMPSEEDEESEHMDVAGSSPPISST